MRTGTKSVSLDVVELLEHDRAAVCDSSDGADADNKASAAVKIDLIPSPRRVDPDYTWLM